MITKLKKRPGPLGAVEPVKKGTVLPVLILTKHYAMKAYGEVVVYIDIFLTSALAGDERSVSSTNRLNPGEEAPSTHWIGDWVDPRVGLDYVEKRKFLTLTGLKFTPLGRPARSQ
jgi:hypothetical protein